MLKYLFLMVFTFFIIYFFIDIYFRIMKNKYKKEIENLNKDIIILKESRENLINLNNQKDNEIENISNEILKYKSLSNEEQPIDEDESKYQYPRQIITDLKKL